jgi:hypothetical protein
VKKFLIPKGKHYPKGFHFGFTFKRKIEFEAMFDKSCLYHFGDVDDYDINKLFGMSTTWFHHRQSARIGWRCVNGREIEILTYSYNKGERKIEEHDILGTVLPGEKFTCIIEDQETDYVFRFKKEDDISWTNAHDAKHPDWFIFHYFLWPYFGGNKTAPHDMIIYLNRI